MLGMLGQCELEEREELWVGGECGKGRRQGGGTAEGEARGWWGGREKGEEV